MITATGLQIILINLLEEKMETVLTDSGVAYHIMMFINREKTSTEHRICEDAFWNTMAEKKVLIFKSIKM